MKTLKYPSQKKRESLILRPARKPLELQHLTASIFRDIKKNGDKAVRKYTLKFDRVSQETFLVPKKEIQKSGLMVSQKLKKAIQLAKNNIEKFHFSQKESIQKTETTPGVVCWRESRAIEKVGIYIPGGTAPLFSTVLMLGIPAKMAGCNEIVLCTPPDRNGKVNPVILYTAQLVGITKIYAVGGIQAIGAMTLGTETIPAVSKIFGPGNQYVTAAKQMAQQYGTAIDMPAGPSEVLIIADKTGDPEFIAADLLSQAEHGSDSQVMLVSDNEKIILRTIIELKKQLRLLPRKEMAQKALSNSNAILFSSIDECINFSNAYAPEHLILACRYSKQQLQSVTNAGSVFLGNYSCESAGDYASGTNHTLPTNRYAKNYSGVSLDSFIKKITFQKITAQGIRNIGPAIEEMAAAEQLEGHKNAVSIRLKKLTIDY